MDPLSLGIAAAGIGLQLFGGAKASQNAAEQAKISQQIAADEMKINDQKRLQMQLESRRSQLQNMRNAQRLRAQATAAAVNQGATMGSGLAGGLSQITGMENWNAVNLGQNLSIGETIFGLNNSISGSKMQMANLQGQQATNISLMSLGGSLVNNAGTIGKFFGGGNSFGTKSNSNPYFAPLDYNG